MCKSLERVNTKMANDSAVEARSLAQVRGGGLTGSGSIIDQGDENERLCGKWIVEPSEPIKYSWKQIVWQKYQNIISRLTVDTQNIQEQNKTYPVELAQSTNVDKWPCIEHAVPSVAPPQRRTLALYWQCQCPMLFTFGQWDPTRRIQFIEGRSTRWGVH